MKIAVGLSGGVDSTLTALLLKEQGYDVVGISMSLYNKTIPNLKLSDNSCYGPEEKEDIHLIHQWCQKQGIEHHIFDLSDDFQKTILKYFKETYLSGATPNPCIMCNAGVKFGLLLEKARSTVDFDYFATGHYAQIKDTPHGKMLACGVDEKKDQSYFLYRLAQKQLSSVIFPLGQFTKSQVRQMAKERGLIQAEKKDSQDFYSGDYTDLLQVKDKKGDVVLMNGQVIGHHQGFWNYTIGQRKGLGIAYPEPLYVIRLNAQKNQVIVGPIAETYTKTVYIQDIVESELLKRQDTLNCLVKYRSTGIPVSASIKRIKKGFQIDFETPQKSITPGQSAVFYQNDLVLGGGILFKSN